MSYRNAYEDETRAQAYAKLGFPGSYYLAFRDLPELIAKHVWGRRALDFGCGTGRSTKFVRKLGFDVIGIDISEEMLQRARELDPDGDYRRVADGDFSSLGTGAFDLVFSAFAFDNIGGADQRCSLLSGLGRLLGPEGRLVLLDSTPEIYTHEWASFSTRDFPENRQAASGDVVRIVMKDVEDRRPVEDVLWRHEDYLEQFAASGLKLLEQHRPLGLSTEPFEWESETEIAPWVIYVLAG